MPHKLVVNIHHKEEYDVYCGRPSKWGNPFVLNDFAVREEIIEFHHNWLITHNRKLLKDLGELTGKRLGCFCAPKPCHCDTLARMANNPMTVRAYAGKP